jgi:CHAT domain
MTARAYDNFDLLIESIDAAQFRVRVTHCEAGDSPALITSLPFSDLQLENVLLKLDPGRSGTRRLLDPYAQASVDMGTGLFDAVFRDDVLLAWSRSVDLARGREHGVRLRLRLADAPQLAGLPWELLYDKTRNRFFAQSDRTPIVRYLDVSDPPRPLVVGGPLHILVIISSPQDRVPLDVDKEWEGIHAALAEKERAGLVVVDRLPQASLGELQKWLRRHEVHVLHFVGHGDFDERTGEGLVAFCDPYGRAVAVSASQLGAHVRDHDSLRLVVLNACQTATTDNVDAYSGIAQGLIQQEAPAVVAMQFPITDGAAIVFTSEFYGALADGEPVDQAVTSARKAMLSDFVREWATPVLFLRAQDGRIFDRIVPGQLASADVLPPVEARSAQEARRLDFSSAQPDAATVVLPSVGTAPATEPPTPQERSVPPERPVPPAHPRSKPPRRRPSRRRWILAAIIALVLAGTVAWITNQSLSSVAHNQSAPSSTGKPKTSGAPSGSTHGGNVGGGGTGGASCRGGYVVIANTTAYSGPSAGAYKVIRNVRANACVSLRCALYGASYPGTANSLWYLTDGGFVNDHFVKTDRSDPIRPACQGNLNSPGVGGNLPSQRYGPFGVVGRSGPITLFDTPSLSGTRTGSLPSDTLVWIACHVRGDVVSAVPGGVSSSDWDRLRSGGYVPDAYLLSGGANGSPAPLCVTTGNPPAGPPANAPDPVRTPSPTPTPSPIPTPSPSPSPDATP